MLPESIQKATESIAQLPGIGPKTAQRLVFFLLKRTSEKNTELSEAIKSLHKDIMRCEVCQNYCETSPCSVCTDPGRSNAQITVLESPIDAINMENTSYKGKYHVLHGVLSPMDGITPQKLGIEKLIDRIKKISEEHVEIILATSPSMEGESTASYIEKQLENQSHIKCTRLARGLPVGADLEYIDEITLQRAFDGRK